MKLQNYKIMFTNTECKSGGDRSAFIIYIFDVFVEISLNFINEITSHFFNFLKVCHFNLFRQQSLKIKFKIANIRVGLCKTVILN